MKGYAVSKRMFDLFVSLFLSLFLWPLALGVGILVAIRLGKPVLFTQRRVGLNSKIFYIYKFRTMTNQRDAQGHLLPDEKRLTSLGQFLRSTSLDELPQLLNVIKGDLSLVGPRPLLPQYLERYSERQKKRHLVPPGITGWAQVNGRNASDWPTRLELDVWYQENWTFPLDLKILLLTIKTVFLRQGVVTSSGTFMPEFQGNPKSSDS